MEIIIRILDVRRLEIFSDDLRGVRYVLAMTCLNIQVIQPDIIQICFNSCISYQVMQAGDDLVR